MPDHRHNSSVARAWRQAQIWLAPIVCFPRLIASGVWCSEHSAFHSPHRLGAEEADGIWKSNGRIIIRNLTIGRGITSRRTESCCPRASAAQVVHTHDGGGKSPGNRRDWPGCALTQVLIGETRQPLEECAQHGITGSGVYDLKAARFLHATGHTGRSDWAQCRDLSDILASVSWRTQKNDKGGASAASVVSNRASPYGQGCRSPS